MYVEVLGYTGGILLSLQLIPQIIQIIKTRSAKDLSTSFLCINLVGLSCTCLFGILQNNPPLYIPLIFSVTVTIIILFLKLYFDSKYTTTVDRINNFTDIQSL